MRPVVLLAANFVRESRWPILLLLAWFAVSFGLFGGFGAERIAPDDVVFYLRQQALYIVVFAVFLCASALHHDRRSRRILLVLSKSINRGQYLAALLLGTLSVTVFNCIALAASVTGLMARSGSVANGVWQLALAVLAAAAVASSLALLFATFLNPFLATTLTAVVLGAPALLHVEKQAWAILSPALLLLNNVLEFQLQTGWMLNSGATAAALLETILLLGVAALVFARIDISLPGE